MIDITKGKESLDIYFPENEIDRDGGFDIRRGKNGFPEVLDVNKGKWYSLFTKVGEDFKPKSFGKMTDRIKNKLGPSAEKMMNELTEKLKVKNKAVEVKEDDISEINTQLSEKSELIGSNQSQMQEIVLEREDYNNSEDHT